MNEFTHNYYCDESCHLNNREQQFMVLGYVSIPYKKINRYKEELKQLRDKHKNYYEIKWTKLDKWNYPFYSDVIDFFFDKIDIRFRAILVDKFKYTPDKCDHDYDKFYYKMYYQLIYHLLYANCKYNIYLDIKDDLSTYRINELKKILNVQMGIINGIQHVRSHEIIFLQICDLLIGALAYNLNNKDKQSLPKCKIIDKIANVCGVSLTETSPLSATKFNIFRINI